MLRQLKARATAPPVNSSRHYLRAFAAEAAAVGHDKSFRVLDVGAGRAPYRNLFAHVTYETSDIKDTGEVDHVCDLTRLSMPDETYDLVFCSQTLEHVKQPVRALKEIHRVLKPGGQAWLSAPLLYEEHQKPVDYFRYTRFAWRYMARQAHLDVEEIDWLEGAYGAASYQLQMAYRMLPADMRLARMVLLHLSRRLARRDLTDRVVGNGMPKNYRVVLTKPRSDGTELLPRD